MIVKYLQAYSKKCLYITHINIHIIIEECKTLIDCVNLGNLTILSVFPIVLQGICIVILKKK